MFSEEVSNNFKKFELVISTIYNKNLALISRENNTIKSLGLSILALENITVKFRDGFYHYDATNEGY